MSPESSPLWPIQPHTKGKHLVLGAYLKAWLPILSNRNNRVLFIDGFAGPGEYAQGEQGSPLVALNTLIEHQGIRNRKCQFHFRFIERDSDRAAHLEARLQALRLSPQCHYKVENSTFEDTLSEYLEHQQFSTIPTFVMI